MLGTPSLTEKAIVIGKRVQNFRCRPAGGQRIERKASTKIHHGYDRPVLGLQYLAPAAPKMPAGQADGGGERDAPDHEEPRSPSFIKPLKRPYIERDSGHVIGGFRLTCYG